MKKLFVIALSVLGGLAVIGVVAYFAGPTFIASTVEAELRERLERRGVDAQWAHFEAGYGGQFVMRSARFEVARFGAELEAESIVVTVDPRSAFEETPRVEAIDLAGVTVRLDLAAGDDEQTKDGASSGSGSSFLERVLEAPPGVTLTDAELIVVRGSEAVATMAASRADFEPIERGWYVVASGSSRVEVEGVPEVFRAELPWQLAASLFPLDRRADFRLAGPDGSPLLALEEKELVRAELGALAGRVELDERHAEIEAQAVALRLGPEATPGIDLAIKRGRVRFDGQRIDQMVAVEPQFTITPGRLGPVRAGLSWLRAVVGGEAAETESTEDLGPYIPPRYRLLAAWRRASDFVATTDLYVKGLTLDIKLESDTGSTFEPITVLETLDARAVSGEVYARGETAGGAVTGRTRLVPGSLWPEFIEATIADVKLGEMPGMPSTRSKLPNRGTSGRVGGELDATFAASFPLLGSRGFALQDPALLFGSLDWNEGVIDLEGVSEEALDGIDLTFDFIARGIPALNEFDMLDWSLTYGPAVVRGTGSLVDAPLDPVVTVRAELEEIECQDLFRAAPVGLLGPYRALEMEGEWAPTFYMRLPFFRPRGFRMKFDGYEDLCTITDLSTYNKWLPEIAVKETAPTGPHLHARPLPVERATDPRWDDVHWLNAPFVKRVTEGLSTEEVVVEVGPGMPDYVPLHELPGYVGGAAFLSEEMDFYEDGPINLNLINKAVRLNLEKGRFQYGGSTVTQQLVKNLFLTRDKTFARKFQEALISWRITDVVSKDRVLELYLNVIEFGPDIYGIGPAAQYYFQKDARQLSSKEAIFLAMLKPAPWYGPKVVERGKTPISGWWAGRYEELYQRLVDYDYLTQAQVEAAKPYYLEWDDDGKYVPSAPPSILDQMGDDLLNLFPQ